MGSAGMRCLCRSWQRAEPKGYARGGWGERVCDGWGERVCDGSRDERDCGSTGERVCGGWGERVCGGWVQRAAGLGGVRRRSEAKSPGYSPVTGIPFAVSSVSADRASSATRALSEPG